MRPFLQNTLLQASQRRPIILEPPFTLTILFQSSEFYRHNHRHMISNWLIGAPAMTERRMTERRQVARARVIYGGLVAYNDRRSTIECVVRDFSNDGARIEFENPALLPDHVDLLITKKNKAFHADVVWRDARQAGLSFLSGLTDKPIPLDWARRLRKCESERRALQGKIDRLLSEI